ESGAATGESLGDARAHFRGDILEMAIAEVFVDQAWILEGLSGVVALNLRVDVAIDLNDVGPAVIVVIDEAAAPRDILIVDANPGGKGSVAEGSIAVVVIEVAGVVGEVCFENVEPAIAVVVGHAHAHAGLLVAILAVGDAGDDGLVGKGAVVIVAEQDAGLRI